MDVGADVGQIRRLHAQPLCHSDRDNARQTLETELDLTACQKMYNIFVSLAKILYTTCKDTEHV